ncbi:glycosyl hydrolase family 16 [Mucilaginibacter frigoritolerans]|jgi:beta-glucanase (GH16 family)|uniref:Glycosyl hydrolase family 16 n=1 Tax=Mucilaginibacter frigoritolerans TaxID=652788 RepID=A0A562TVF6_9SPHI|nr:glycoside hydrolase family 16 protein [Mucilaginibacter frigoritolerans]TWI97144.1 glycosyl hydrolase family 16 [Mucilaginibacter frigoritolerans]
MRKHFIKQITSTGFILVLAFFAFSCKKSQSTFTPPPVTTTPPPVTSPDTSISANYTLVWSDEFNGISVDTTKWNFETGNLNVNHEKEYYQASNATVANGNLVITAKKESVGGQPYTSARLNTQGKVTAQYGRIEARIKLPLGAGLWPAFWMLGSDITTVSWPQCGEMDIMEHINADNTIYGTMHWNVNGATQYGLNTQVTNPDAYHIYAIEWNSGSINWYVDNTLYCTGNIQNNINNTGAFQMPFFIILNLAVAGDFPGQTVDESKLPASMYVDYVRVYKAK